MSQYNRPTIQGAPPWGRNETGIEQEPREAAPRQEVTFHCGKGHDFTRPFAAGVKPPDAFDCRCGGIGIRDGAPADTPREVELPGQKTGGPPKDRHAAETTPKAQLLKRRSRAQLEAILAERLAEVGQSKVAP